MKKLVLHLGAHKTGTSLLQRVLHDNRAVLHDAGVFVLAGSDFNNTPVRRLFRGGLNDKALHQEAKAVLLQMLEPAGDRHVIVSYEDFLGTTSLDFSKGVYPQARRRAQLLKELLAGYDVQVILYIRNQPAFVESCYLQVVQQGRAVSFDAFMRPIRPAALNWDKVVTPLEAVFGSVEVRCFEEISRGAVPFVNTFIERCCQWLKMPMAPLNDAMVVDVTHRNPSYSQPALRVALRVQPFLGRRGKDALRYLLTRYLNNQVAPRAALTDGFIKRSMLKQCGPANRKLLERYHLEEHLEKYLS